MATKKKPAPKTAKKTVPRKRSAPKPSFEEMLAALTVEAAVRRDLAKLAQRDQALATSGLAANALRLAKEMDSDSSATSKSMCARALNETMEKIRALAPQEQTQDELDELAARRDKRRARVAAKV